MSADAHTDVAKAVPPEAAGNLAPARNITFTVHLPRALAIKLDGWAASQGMTRAMAIRGLVQAAVGK